MKETFPHNFSSTSGADAWNSLGNIIPTSFLRQLVLKGDLGAWGALCCLGLGQRAGMGEGKQAK